MLQSVVWSTTEEPMTDIGWLVVTLIVAGLARALVRLCERLR